MKCKNIFVKKPEFNFLSLTLFPKVFFLIAEKLGALMCFTFATPFPNGQFLLSLCNTMNYDEASV